MNIDYWAVVWHDSYLVYKAKDDGRIFNVKFMNFRYYDAYQMKEVSEWLTDELKNTVDENIDMVNIRDTAVYGIYDEEKVNTKMLFGRKIMSAKLSKQEEQARYLLKQMILTGT